MLAPASATDAANTSAVLLGNPARVQMPADPKPPLRVTPEGSWANAAALWSWGRGRDRVGLHTLRSSRKPCRV